ncbi:hypothetical protein RLOatenuis_7100 [Rickettsiales bacterium]|nr:hypothetical protein RLOatenuis_7100 [Rickettsiales bacterium]
MTEYFLKICQTNKKAYYFYYNGIVTPEDAQYEDTENVVAKYKPSKNADSILIDDNDNPLALLIPSLKKINDFPTIELVFRSKCK